MALKNTFIGIFFKALIIAIVIHTILIFVLAKTNVFNFFNYFNQVLISNLYYETNKQELTNVDNPVQSDEDLELQNEPPEEIESVEQNIAEEQINGLHYEDSSLAKNENQLPNVRLEVPKLHSDLLKNTLIEEKDGDRLILKYRHENLDYNLYWIGMYVGRAKLQASGKDSELTITSEVHSSELISKFYRVQDYAKSVVLDGKPHRFRIKQHEGKYRSDKETFFDYNEGTITFVDYLKNKQMEHVVKDNIYWDVISGFYYLRSMPVINTDNISVNVFDSNKFIKVQIIIIGKEKIEMRNGNELDTIKVKVILHSEGLFQKVGDIIIWLKDDEDRIPLKVETKVPVGKVTAELITRNLSK